MCNFFSGILKKDGKVLSLEDTSNHEAIVKQFKLKEEDDTKKWLRFEITQKDGDNDNRDLRTWKIKIDEPTTPDWYYRNKSFLDKQIRKALKKQFVNEIDRFPIDEEAKLLKTFNVIFEQSNIISEDKAVEMDNVSAVDPAHVIMVKAKTERAKRIISRFYDRSIKEPNLNYTISPKKKITPTSVYSLDYFQSVLKIIGCIDDHFIITIGKDQPAKIEDDNFMFLLAPRIEEK